MAVLVILSRWLHVIAATLAIGGTFFIRVILPLGLAQADAASRDAVFLRCRRAFKRVIHTCVLLLLLTGAFNTWRNWGDYRLDRPLMHALWGPHMLLGLTAMVIALLLLGPKEPPAWRRTGAMVNLIILLTTVLFASTLKYVHDRAIRNPPSPPPAAAVAPAGDR
jgi:putative copper export protein